MEYGAGQIILFILIVIIILSCLFTSLFRVYEMIRRKRNPQTELNNIEDSSSLVDPDANVLAIGRKKSHGSSHKSQDDSVSNLFSSNRPDIFINDDNETLNRVVSCDNSRSMNSVQGISLLSIDSNRSSNSSSSLLLPVGAKMHASSSLSLRPSDGSLPGLNNVGVITFGICLDKTQRKLVIKVVKCSNLSTVNIIRRHSATPEYSSKKIHASSYANSQNNPRNQAIVETYVTMMYKPDNEESVCYRLQKSKTHEGTSVYNSTIEFTQVDYEKVFNTSLLFMVHGVVKAHQPGTMGRIGGAHSQMNYNLTSIFLGSVDFGKIAYSLSLSDETEKLKTVPLLTANENMSLSKQLRYHYEFLPQLYLSIMYNPDEKTISVTIVKAKRLAKPVVNDYTSNHVSSFVKLTVYSVGVRSNNARNSIVSETYNTRLPGCSMEILLKKQTQVRQKTRFPKYNETFTFTLPTRIPLELLPNSLILDAQIFHSFNQADCALAGSLEAAFIGQVVLGQHSIINTSSANSRYWWKVFKNPGKSLSDWHEIN